MARITVINGPNLNLLGDREQAIYGNESLDHINARLLKQAKNLDHELHCFQSNAEHELINFMHQIRDTTDLIIINPAAFTHTSIALRDALLATDIPYIEVHLSNIYAREPFRQQSYFSDIANGVISGFGSQGYDFALQAAHAYLNKLELTHGHS